MNVRHAYARWAGTYDTDPNPTRDLDEAVTRQSLAGRRFGSILEIGCGTGKNTAFLATIGDRVCAIDFSDAMLAKAREKILSNNVTFSVADITAAWPCADNWANLIACNLVLEHVADLTPVFHEAFRSLAPGGCLFVCELHPYRQYQGKKANFRQDEETVEIDATVHHLSDFVNAAHRAEFELDHFAEWWQDEDRTTAPRLVSFMFCRS